MKTRGWWAVALACLFFQLDSHASASHVISSGHQMAADSSIDLYGASLTVPNGWTVEQRKAFALIRPPEAGFDMYVTRVEDATDAVQAATHAWDVVRPGFHDLVAERGPRGAIRGWDEFVLVNYDTPASENRISLSAVFRLRKQWTVFTVQASRAVLERRQAELGKLTASIVPQNYISENLVGRAPHAMDEGRIIELRRFVRASMKALRIPGAAIALVQGDKILLEEGMGVRTLGRPEQVDAHTRFMIASNTKGMTTLLLARLVDQGKLRWDQPVEELVPGLKLADAAATRKLEVRHLVCACTGLPRADYETYFVDPDASAQLAFDQLAQLRPTTDFGATYQYNNTLPAVAGFVAGYVAYPQLEKAQGYDRAMRELVWQPLGMYDTSFDDPRTVKGDFAAPHADRLDGSIGFAPQGLNATLLPFRPTGGAWSSIHDMALYVRNEVTEGRLPGGRQWVSRDALLARRAHGVSTGKDSWYGMGVESQLVGGIEIVFHGGAVNGYKSGWMVVPKARIGVAILTNGDNGYPLVTAFRRKLIEVLYDAKPEADAFIVSESRRAEEMLKAQRTRILRPVPPGSDLAARYDNPLLGKILVRHVGSATVFDFGPWSIEIGAKSDTAALGGYDYVSIAPSEIEDLAFVPGHEGRLRTLTLRDEQHSYVYREVEAH